jgi:hypothetical protein
MRLGLCMCVCARARVCVCVREREGVSICYVQLGDQELATARNA